MSATEILAMTTGVWAVAMAVSPALQIRQMVQTGSSDDVSIPYFGVLIIGFLLWIAYGFTRSDLVLVIPNSIAAAVGIATVVVALRFRRP